jgi:hypothetical protein
VFIWFASWKNGTSSYAPCWGKKDYVRIPRIQIGAGKTVSISGPVELLSTFGEATRDADATAFRALMRHIKEVDGARHTVVMMQVGNEVGVLRDSQDRSPAANRAFAGKVVEAGKAGCNIPIFVNAWLQQPDHAWPGTFPSGGPLPQVHDICRAGAPGVDILAPDLYLEFFDRVCERLSRGGNPLFIPGTSTEPANVIVATARCNAIGFSPFGIDGNRPIPPNSQPPVKCSRSFRP